MGGFSVIVFYGHYACVDWLCEAQVKWGVVGSMALTCFHGL